MNKFRNILAANLKNIIRGTKVPEKLIIFESDDWGSNRIASTEDFKNLVKHNILNNNASVYDRCDTIARPHDLEILFDTLSSVKDKYDETAKITFFFNPVNPDFDRIRNSEYQEYFYEDFINTLNKESNGENVLKLWNNAISANLATIAYHGREHVCVQLWMKFLKSGNDRVKEAFKYKFYAVPNVNGLTTIARAFRPTLYFDNFEQKKFIQNSLKNGLEILSKIFNTPISVFAPPNGVCCLDFDKELSFNGIKLIHNTFRFEPDGEGNGKHTKIKKNKYGQKYYNRTCAFEPVISNNAVDLCLRQIQGAFNWNKPAIISTHRVNYMGNIDPKNRDNGIRQLQLLLKTIIKKWPDAVFVSSNDFAKIIFED